MLRPCQVDIILSPGLSVEDHFMRLAFVSLVRVAARITGWGVGRWRLETSGLWTLRSVCRSAESGGPVALRRFPLSAARSVTVIRVAHRARGVRFPPDRDDRAWPPPYPETIRDGRLPRSVLQEPGRDRLGYPAPEPAVLGRRLTARFARFRCDYRGPAQRHALPLQPPQYRNTTSDCVNNTLPIRDTSVSIHDLT
jgi:hypothetical protein